MLSVRLRERPYTNPLHKIVQDGASRRIGRPLSYDGDPEKDPGLTAGERKQLKRRIANRESARRARDRRINAQADMEERVRLSMHHVQALFLCEAHTKPHSPLYHQLAAHGSDSEPYCEFTWCSWIKALFIGRR